MADQQQRRIRSVAVVGAGASGAITAAALAAEKSFDRIRVFERRETAGGTWIYDAKPDHSIVPRPGALPTELDVKLAIPELGRDGERKTVSPNGQERYDQTPIYEDLTTNVPAIAMSFSDAPFAYGPFVPHYISRQYVENYFSIHNTDAFLSLRTTVEDVSKLEGDGGWKLTLRKYNVVGDVDEWWTETFDAVVFGNGHYSIPYIPEVKGLEAFIAAHPGRVQHSKSFRTGREYENLRVLVVGNSASGHDITASLNAHAKQPVFQSRRHPSRWDPADDTSPEGIIFKPIISEYQASGRIVFEDGSVLDDIDKIVYCTGYKPSYPFWNEAANGGALWDYEQQRLPGIYLHTFLNAHPTIGFVGGLGLVLTFRSFEYQAVALARVFAGRSRTFESISLEEKQKWESDRLELVRREGRKFHDVHPLMTFAAFKEGEGEAWEYLTQLTEIAGLPTLDGKGRAPPALGNDIRWALEHQRKYPEPGRQPKAVLSEMSDVQEDQKDPTGVDIPHRRTPSADNVTADSSRTPTPSSESPDTSPGTPWLVVERHEVI